MASLPVPENEEQRLKALQSYEILDSLSEGEYDRITKLATIICGVPIALVNLIDQDRQWFKSKVGMDIDGTIRELSFCQYTIMGTELLEIPDASDDDRFKDNAFVVGDEGVRFYAGYPLIDPQGFALGSLCVVDYKPHILSNDQKEAMRLLTEEVMQLIVEHRLKEELRNFERLFLLSNDLICVASTDGSFKKINPAVEKLLGWTPAEMMQKNMFDLVHPSDLATVVAEMEGLKKGTAVINSEQRVLTADGTYKIFQFVVSPEENTHNIYAVGRDITKLRESERKLAESETKLRAVFENSQGFICTHDLEGNLISINPSGALMLGYSIEELQEMSLFDVVPKVRHPYLEAYLQEIQRSGRGSGQMMVTLRDGSLRTLLFNNVLEQIPGRKPYVIGNALDITERKAIEKKLHQVTDILRSFVAHTPAAVAMMDIDMNYVAVSNRWLEDYGLVGKDIIGTSYYEHFKFINEEGRQRHRRVLMGQIVTKDEDIYLGSASGEKQFIKWEMRPWFESADNIGGMMIFTQNITDIVNQREELKVARDAADQASTAKSEFVASMSHEIRTPLNGVIGFTDLVLKTELSDTQQQYLSIVNQSANSLLGIINDILDFSKIEAGKLELDIEECDLYEISGQATDIITYQVQKKGLEMLLNLSPDLPRFIWTDSIRMKQILVNLLGNAAKFTEAGEIELKIQALDQVEGQTLMRFSVRDTGIGIKTDRIDKIFEAFAQEDASTTKKYGGTGLGLAISNRLLGLMGSKLQLESTLGKGSRFFFDVWVKAEQGEPKQWENISWIKKVLIVDDNDNNRLILEQMLLLKGIDSVLAKNGFEALQLLATGEKFDVILMDYHMPYIDGLDTISKIRESFDETETMQPIVLLFSSSDDETIIRRCEELQVNARLVKPVKMSDLYGLLSRILLKERVKSDAVAVLFSGITEREIKIIVADDNPVNMLLAKTIIGRAAINAEVIEATNGFQAVEHFKTEAPDLILMDVQMPAMNGYEATAAIRKIEAGNSHVPIIALTAGNVKDEREKCMDAGMDDFVVKPVVEETIIQILKKWLQIHDDSEAADILTPGIDMPHFDINVLKGNVGDDAMVLAEILSLTKEQLRKSLSALKNGIDEQQMTVVSAEGHKMYGTAVSAGFPALAVLAREMELLSGEDVLQATELYPQIKEEIDLCIELI